MIYQENLRNGMTSVEHALEYISEKNAAYSIEVSQELVDGRIKYKTSLVDEYGVVAEGSSLSLVDAIIELGDNLQCWIDEQADEDMRD